MTYVKAYSATSDDGTHVDTIDIGNDNYILLTANAMELANSFHFNAIATRDIDDTLVESNNPNHNFIYRMFTYDSGGHCMVDVMMLPDGRYIGITDDCIVLYPQAPNDDEFLQASADECIVINIDQ